MNKRIKKIELNRIVKSLKNNFNTNELISEFSNFYIKSNNLLSCDILLGLSEFKKYSNCRNKVLFNRINNLFSVFSLKDLEAVFESLIDLDRKKREGAVYTPNYIIDYIIKYSLQNFKGKYIPIICDPACGSGGFLVRSIEILSKKYNISIVESVEYVKGIDINSQSVSCAKIIIELFFLSKNIVVKSLDNNIICEDTLIRDKNILLKKLNSENGIDVIVTNPPYVKLQNIDNSYRKELIKKYSNFTNGGFSLAMLFLIAGKELLSKDGMLGYITQNNFFTSLASKKIREFLQNNKCIHTIIDFLHTKIFKNASAYTCLIFLENSQKLEEFNFMWALDPINDLEKNNFSKINIKALNSEKWRMAPKKHLDNINKIETIGYRLGEIADIKVGFATLKDSIFLIDGNNPLNLEEGVLKSAIKISELDNEESILDKTRKIIFPYQKVKHRYVAYNEDDLKELFPLAYKYLLKNKELLKRRSEAKKGLKNFYEWGRIQGMEAPGYKLLTKTFSSKPNFMLDKTDSLFCNGYSVKPKVKKTNDQEINIIILQKILNSSIMDYYSKLTSFQLDGNYQCFQKNFIELFCIPKLDKKDKDFILNKSGSELNQYLANLYKIDFKDLEEIINR